MGKDKGKKHYPMAYRVRANKVVVEMRGSFGNRKKATVEEDIIGVAVLDGAGWIGKLRGEYFVGVLRQNGGSTPPKFPLILRGWIDGRGDTFKTEKATILVLSSKEKEKAEKSGELKPTDNRIVFTLPSLNGEAVYLVADAA